MIIKLLIVTFRQIIFINSGDYIRENDIIAKVGPKNVYGIKNNPYKDSNDQPTNGATTGCHLHLTIKKNKKAIDPLQFFK